MSFLDSFKKLFSKKEDGTEKKRQQIEHSLHAKIRKEKDARELIEKNRREQKKEYLVKKRNKTLSSNF